MSSDLTPAELGALRSLAERAARVGGAVAKASYGRIQRVELKADQSEVTEIDVAAERAVIAAIERERADDSFIGEESIRDATHARRSGGVCWVIDPIDGTRNYIRGLPLFACSVGVLADGYPVAGAIFDPLRDVLYSAAAGQGYAVNGKAVSIAENTPPTAGELGKLFVAIPSARSRSGQELVRHVIEAHVVRNFGSAALHLALVASGRIDAAVLNNCKLWDIAAGWVMVTEAGGCVTELDGDALPAFDPATYTGENTPVLAGSQAAHARLVSEQQGE